MLFRLHNEKTKFFSQNLFDAMFKDIDLTYKPDLWFQQLPLDWSTIPLKLFFEPKSIKNNENEMFKAVDLRTTDHFPKISNYINKNLPVLHRLVIIRKIVRYLFYSHNFIVKIKHYFKLKKYFKILSYWRALKILKKDQNKAALFEKCAI